MDTEGDSAHRTVSWVGLTLGGSSSGVLAACAGPSWKRRAQSTVVVVPWRRPVFAPHPIRVRALFALEPRIAALPIIRSIQRGTLGVE